MHARLSTAPSTLDPPGPVDHGQRRTLVMQCLLTDIVHGRLRAGERLVIQELAARFAVSPTPIREALAALQGVGVIDLAPNRGAVVRRMSPQDVREMSAVRGLLESEATRQACGRLAPAQLQQLSSRLRALQQVSQANEDFYREAREVDSSLHDAIAASCGNAFLAQELNRLKLLFRAFRDVSYDQHQQRDDFYRIVEEADEHLLIVQSLLAGQRRAAAQAMARHIRSGVRYWTGCLPSSGER